MGFVIVFSFWSWFHPLLLSVPDCDAGFHVCSWHYMSTELPYSSLFRKISNKKIEKCLDSTLLIHLPQNLQGISLLCTLRYWDDCNVCFHDGAVMLIKHLDANLKNLMISGKYSLISWHDYIVLITGNKIPIHVLTWVEDWITLVHYYYYSLSYPEITPKHWQIYV